MELVRSLRPKSCKMINVFSILIFLVFLGNKLNARPLRYSRIRRNAFRDESRLWPKATVPYTIDEAYTKGERQIIENAMKTIQSTSCIRFKKQRKEEVFVEIVRGTGCRATVGYTGRKQQLILGYGCLWKTLVLHELLHVLGFFHEHTRPDRDKFVAIYEDNVESYAVGNFRKMSNSTVTTLGLPYDYRSVLHYREAEFAMDKSKKTIEAVAGSKLKHSIGMAANLSLMDIIKVNKLYSCMKKKKHLEDEGSGDTGLENNFIIVSR